jgi:hypothetical protein
MLAKVIRVLAAIAATSAAPAFAAVKTPTQIRVEANENFRINTPYSPLTVRDSLRDIADSMPLASANNSWSGVQTFSAMPVFPTGTNCYLRARGALQAACDAVVSKTNGGAGDVNGVLQADGAGLVSAVATIGSNELVRKTGASGVSLAGLALTGDITVGATSASGAAASYIITLTSTVGGSPVVSTIKGGLDGWATYTSLGHTFNGPAKIPDGLLTSVLAPLVDGTAAFKFTKADKTTGVVWLDTTNTWLGVGVQPSDMIHGLRNSTAAVFGILQNRSAAGAPEVGWKFVTGARDPVDDRWAGITSEGGASPTLKFWTGDNVSPLVRGVLTAAGLWGFGTTTPEAVLHARTDAGALTTVAVLQNRNASALGACLSYVGGAQDVSANRMAQACSIGSTQTDYVVRVSNNAAPAEAFRIANNGRIGLGGNTSPSFDLAWKAGGGVNRVIALERQTSGAGAGDNLFIRAGDAILASTDKGGGAVYISGGRSTGANLSEVHIQTAAAGPSGTADNSLLDRLYITGTAVLLQNGAKLGFESGTATPCTNAGYTSVLIGGSTKKLMYCD